VQLDFGQPAAVRGWPTTRRTAHARRVMIHGACRGDDAGTAALLERYQGRLPMARADSGVRAAVRPEPGRGGPPLGRWPAGRGHAARLDTSGSAGRAGPGTPGSAATNIIAVLGAAEDAARYVQVTRTSPRVSAGRRRGGRLIALPGTPTPPAPTWTGPRGNHSCGNSWRTGAGGCRAHCSVDRARGATIAPTADDQCHRETFTNRGGEPSPQIRVQAEHDQQHAPPIRKR